MGRGFQPRLERVHAKTFYFYGYLLEFLARLLAAHIISGEWTEKLSPEEKKQILGLGYEVELYPLGNGWGFGQLFDFEYARFSFASDLATQTNRILAEAETQEEANRSNNSNGDASGDSSQPLPRVLVRVPDGFGEGDPKEAVVFGLLKAKTEYRRRAEVNWQYRTIVGYTTRVGLTRVVPWYLPVDDNAQLLEDGKVADGEGELPNASLVCPPDQWPSFYNKLISPHELDPGLNRTSNEIQTCLRMSSKWFHQSPFHVILEKLIKPKLKELG
jgi:hypothetical protein